MSVKLLNLVENVLRVIKQLLGTHAGKPEIAGLPGETHCDPEAQPQPETYSSRVNIRGE
jgi:hypothetical protein